MNDKGVGWIMYAWIVLIVVGVWNIIEGIVAISRSSSSPRPALTTSTRI